MFGSFSVLQFSCFLCGATDLQVAKHNELVLFLYSYYAFQSRFSVSIDSSLMLGSASLNILLQCTETTFSIFPAIENLSALSFHPSSSP